MLGKLTKNNGIRKMKIYKLLRFVKSPQYIKLVLFYIICIFYKVEPLIDYGLIKNNVKGSLGSF